MHADFWHQRWADNKIGFHQDEINPYLVEYFPELSLPNAARVFVPLAGKSRDILWLLDQGYEVHAIELSTQAVEHFFQEHSIAADISDWTHGQCFHSEGLHFWSGDIFALQQEQLGPIDAIYDRAALIALPETMRRDYVQTLMNLTGPAKQLLITLEYDPALMEGPPFSVIRDEVEDLYQSRYAHVSRLAEIDVLSKNPHLSSRGLTTLLECVYLLSS